MEENIDNRSLQAIEISDTTYLQEMSVSIRRNSPDTCRQMAEWAGEHRQANTIPALKLLLKPARGLWHRLQPRHQAWRQARFAAVVALNKIGDASAIPLFVHQDTISREVFLGDVSKLMGKDKQEPSCILLIELFHAVRYVHCCFSSQYYPPNALLLPGLSICGHVL